MPRHSIRSLAPLVIALAVVSCSRGAQLPETSVPATAPLRVLVYNIHAGKDAGGVDNLERVAALIREQRVDIALLQEVDVNTERSGRIDQPAVLSKLSGLHAVFGRTLDYQGGQYGIAVLSRFAVERDTMLALAVEPAQERAGGSREPRGVLHAQIRAPGGRLHVLNTHLDASGDDHWRRQEAARVALAATRIASGSQRLLVGGDFNAEPGTPTIQLLTSVPLRDGWAVCGGGGPGLSYPAAGPVKRIDYLFFRPATICQSAEVLASDASDHRPVIFSLLVPAAP